MRNTPDHFESLDTPEQELSLWQKISSGVRGAANKLFTPQPKPRVRRRGLGGAESLEDRLLMSATPAEVRIVNDGESGYTETGTWHESGLMGHDESSTRYAAESGAGAQWQFDAVNAGWISLEAFVPESDNSTDNAVYSIFSNGEIIGSVPIDQRTGGWKDLGAFVVEDGNIVVSVSGEGSETLRTDAVRISRVGEPSTITTISEPFDEWNDSRWRVGNGSPRVGDSVLYLRSNSVAQMQGDIATMHGNEKTTTIRVFVPSNDRFMWNASATVENVHGDPQAGVDIRTGQYVSIGGVKRNGNIPHGAFTIEQHESADGITVTVTDSQGKEYQGTITVSLEDGAQPSVYGWKGAMVDSVDITVRSEQEELPEEAVDEVFASPQAAEEVLGSEGALEESFDEWNGDRWNSVSGNVSVHDGLLQLRNNGVAQLQDDVVRGAGQTKTVTMTVQINSNDRFLWMPSGQEGAWTNGDGIDINTGQYVGTMGPSGENRTSAAVPGGTYTITTVETDDGVTATVIGPDGRTYTLSFPSSAAENVKPALYGWKNVQVDTISMTVSSPLAEAEVIEQAPAPYAAMHVSPHPDQPRVSSVRFMSNHPQSYFEVRMDGQPGMVYKRTIEHPAGEIDGITEFNIGDVYNGHNGYGNTFDIRMYSDETKTELLDAVSGHFTNGVAVAQTNGVWGELETGRTVENPVTPTISVVKSKGPNILVSFQSPHDGGILKLDGGGYFDQTTMEFSGGEEYGMATLTFNAENPEGNYNLRLYETRNMRSVAGLTFHWDPESGELRLLGENVVISVEGNDAWQEKRDAMKDIFDEETGITSIDVSFASLIEVQGIHMYRASEFFINNDNAYTYINQTSWKDHPDGYSEFIKLLDAYEGALEKMLVYAARMKVAAMNGDSVADAERILREEHHRSATAQYIVELTSFGIHLPSVEAIRDEGMKLFSQMTDMFKNSLVKNETMKKRLAYLADQKEPGTRQRSEQAIDAHLRTLAAVHVGDPLAYEEAVRRYFVGVERREGIVRVEDDPVLIASEDTSESQVLSEESIEAVVRNTITDRVTERLNARLSSMTIEERAAARGLLRLQQQGRLEEYFDAVFVNGVTDAAITQIEEESGVELQLPTYAFLVTRPLGSIPGASHNFIVVGARYRGDPNATVYSFGQTDNWQVGLVDQDTQNFFSRETNQNDIDAWLSLNGAYDINSPIQIQLIPASSDSVKSFALSVKESQDYAAIAGIFGANSNSAAQAIANAAAGMEVPIPNTGRLSPGAGSHDEIEFTNDSDE